MSVLFKSADYKLFNKSEKSRGGFSEALDSIKNKFQASPPWFLFTPLMMPSEISSSYLIDLPSDDFLESLSRPASREGNKAGETLPTVIDGTDVLASLQKSVSVNSMMTG